MKLPLSDRLLACSNFVARGDRVADVGCDHGYLGIHLLLSGIASSVIASDINKMPLQSAINNAEKYGVREKMSFYLSDGAKNIPRDFDTMICAGIGADTIISILDAAPWLKDSKYRLILQCQSKTPMLRKYLSDQGWRIFEEHVLRDGRFLYTVMEVIWQPGYLLTPGECYFPPALLENPDKELPEYYQSVIRMLSRAVTGRGEHADPIHIAALDALRQLAETSELSWLKEESQ